jgi:indole-3-acetate monooxygenase
MVGFGDKRRTHAMTEEMRLPADVDAQPLVTAAAALQPVIRKFHDEIEREGGF